MQEKYGSDLQVIFVESQGSSRDNMEGFALRRKWLGTQAMWTTERPLRTGSRGLPNYVLIGADGAVIEKGSHVNSRTSDLIEEQIKSGGQAPEGTPGVLKAAWKSFLKGDVGKAMTLASKVRDKGKFASQASDALASFEAAVGRSLDQVEWCIENGMFLEAQEKLRQMMNGLQGTGDLLERASLLSARISSPEMKTEVDACKKLARLLDKVHEEGFGKKDKHRRALEKFAQAHPGTMAATRARHLSGL
ncbi:MAG: hypothetical protein ACI82F_003527 [Planctomycetota bacterium]|jgi:hypothetical protein